MHKNNNHVKPNYYLREISRNQLRGSWGSAVLVFLVYNVLNMIPVFIPFAGPLLTFVITGPLLFGFCSCFLLFIRNNSLNIENLLDGFSYFGTTIAAYLLMSIFTFLWSLLFLIPGIIASYRYSMTYFILNDNPEMGALEAITASKEMMIGYKGKLFGLHISFIGWGLLNILTLGIGSLWLVPYIQTSVTNFYENLKEIQNPEEENINENDIEEENNIQE